MLSRVADSLYWMGRYLERAEHTARLLDLNLHWLLDQKQDSIDRRWGRVLESLRTVGLDGHLADSQALGHALIFDAGRTDSVVSCIVAARQNAREVRERISTEMWEQINRLYLRVQGLDSAEIWDGQAHDFLQGIKEGAHLFNGLTDETVSHEEGWHFIRLGRYIERTLALASLLDAHFGASLEPTQQEGADEFLELVGLLKSCTAFEAYCRLYTANLTPERVAEFLLLDEDFPHTVRFSANRVQDALGVLVGISPALKHSNVYRLAGKLTAALGYDDIDEIMADDLHRYLTDIRHRCQLIHETVYEACIAYPIESALPSA